MPLALVPMSCDDTTQSSDNERLDGKHKHRRRWLGFLGYASAKVIRRHYRSEHGSCCGLADTLCPNEEAQYASGQSLQKVTNDEHAVFVCLVPSCGVGSRYKAASIRVFLYSSARVNFFQ